MSYKGIKIKVSKLTFDRLFILCSVEDALGLDFLHSIQFGEKISNTSTKLMCSDFWWFLMNVISKYLFLEQFCQFLERVLKFFSKAGDSIHSFSSCTHIGALKTEWKCIFSWKRAYLYTSIVHLLINRLSYTWIIFLCITDITEIQLVKQNYNKNTQFCILYIPHKISLHKSLENPHCKFLLMLVVGFNCPFY